MSHSPSDFLFISILYMPFLHDWINNQIYNPMAIFQAMGAIATVITLIIIGYQLRANRWQEFDSSFFKLLDLHYNIVSRMAGGREIFSNAVLDLNRNFNYEVYSTIQDEYGGSRPVNEKVVSELGQAYNLLQKEYYNRYYRNYDTELNHYFRNFYHILKYIDKSKIISQKKKFFYSKILRAQLSQNELHVIMFNGMHSKYGYPKAYKLYRKYDITDNLNSDAINPLIYWDLYLGLTDVVDNQQL